MQGLHDLTKQHDAESLGICYLHGILQVSVLMLRSDVSIARLTDVRWMLDALHWI